MRALRERRRSLRGPDDPFASLDEVLASLEDGPVRPVMRRRSPSTIVFCLMSSGRRHPNVIHRDEVPPTIVERGKHRFERRPFGPMTGGRQLGGSLMELAPGAISYPLHFHCANEEAIFVVSGQGTARIGHDRVPVRAGDWIALPIGPAHAHQMINDGDAPLVYLVVGTDHKCEVIGYPDSKKVAAFGGESWDHPWVSERTRAGEALDYWDGEPDA